VIDVFVEALDLHGMGFERVIAKAGRHRALTAPDPAAGVGEKTPAMTCAAFTLAVALDRIDDKPLVAKSFG
jgi:hypothetical protein